MNIHYIDIKQSIPSYYTKNPKIFFYPETPESERGAEIKEILVNQKWSALKMKSKIRESIKATKLGGVCGFKTYFNFSDNFVKDRFDDSQFNDEVRTDVVTVKNLIKEPSCNSWSASPWIGHVIEAPVEDIASKFSIRDKDKISVTKVCRADKNSDEYQCSDIEYGTYYEIEDRKKGETFIIVDGIEKIFNKKDKSYSYDSMWDILEFNDIPDCPETKSDYHFCKSQILELNRYKKMKLEVAKRSVPKNTVVTAEPLTDEQITQLKSAEPGAYLELKPGQQVGALANAQIDNNALMAEQDSRQDIQAVLSQGPAQQTSAPFVKKTATEIKVNEMATQEVSSENRDRVEEVISSIAYKWSVLMEENYTTKRTVSLTGMAEDKFYTLSNTLNDGENETLIGSSKKPYLVVSNKDIVSKAKAHVVAGSTQKESNASRMNSLMGFSQFVSSDPALKARVDPEEMIKEAIKVFGLENENLLVKKDNPTKESEMLNLGVFIEAKISEDHDKHLSIHEKNSNFNEQNTLHILMHKMFQKQLQENKVGEVVSQIKKMQDPLNNLTGQSLLGVPGGSLQAPGQQQGGVNPLQPGQGASPMPNQPSPVRGVG